MSFGYIGDTPTKVNQKVKNTGILSISEAFALERQGFLGGSLELILIQNGKNIHSTSLDIGHLSQISNEEIAKALNSSVSQICDAIKQALDKTPPEHASDIIEFGIILTGGCSL